MWWTELQAQAERLRSLQPHRGAGARIAPGALLEGAVRVEAGAVVCHGACIAGPVVLGEGCRIGNYAMIRGPTWIGPGTCVGYATEIKNAIVGHGVRIGPLCFVADSWLEDEAYLGAMVRTSNHRLDGKTVVVRIDGAEHDSGLEKLGCLVGARARLGIQVVVLPGRVVAPGSLFAPRITIERNLPAGRYRLRQALERF